MHLYRSGTLSFTIRRAVVNDVPSVAHKRNPKLAINYKMGGKIISEEDDYMNVYYDIG
jgi:hypothetical protein